MRNTEPDDNNLVSLGYSSTALRDDREREIGKNLIWTCKSSANLRRSAENSYDIEKAKLMLDRPGLTSTLE